MTLRAKPDYWFLDDYAEVIKRLFPSVRAILFFDADARLIWPGNTQLGSDAQVRLRTGLIDGARPETERADSVVALSNNQHAVLLGLALPSGAPAGICALVLDGPKDQHAASLDDIRLRLDPALQCLARELGHVLASLAQVEIPLERTNDLKWLLDVSTAYRPGKGNPEQIAQVIESALIHLNCQLGALLVSEKHLTVMRTAPSPAGTKAHQALQRLHTFLTQWMHRNNRPLVLDTRKAGEEDGFQVLAVPIVGQSSSPAGVLVFLRAADDPDFTQDQRYLVRLLSRLLAALLEAQFDRTTGLYTRSALQALVQDLPDAAANGCVIHLNIDRLHVINETLGFEAGDELISRTAQLLESASLPQDALAARLSGDAFAVVLPRKDTEAATRYAQSLQQAAADLAESVLGGKAPVSLSCGIAAFTQSSEFGRALALAEVACKTAKDRGRSRVEIYQDADGTMIRRSADAGTLIRLRRVLENDELTLYAQKIVPLKAGDRRTGYELLLRALDEDHENRAPATLLSAAQRYQMESAIDTWVFDRALSVASRHYAELLAAQVSLSINITPQALVDEGFLQRVKDGIARADLAPSLFMFEITETAAVSSLVKAVAFMRELRAMGCRFALDDFGTGVNSLKNLNNLPVDRVKIDGSFVSGLLSNPQSAATVRAIVNLSREFGMETVAEYAENAAVIEQLRELGVDFAQGFGVEKPRPLAEVLSELRARRSGEPG